MVFRCACGKTIRVGGYYGHGSTCIDNTLHAEPLGADIRAARARALYQAAEYFTKLNRGSFRSGTWAKLLSDLADREICLP